MNSPVKRFSLTRIVGSSKPVDESKPIPAPELSPDPPPQELELPKADETEAPVEGKKTPTTPTEEKAKEKTKRKQESRPSSDEIDGQHPKKKRSYSVDLRVCDEFEVGAWFLARSSSSIVEDLMREWVKKNRPLIEKARQARAGR